MGKPESATQHEAGIRFPLLNGRLALTTAVFDVDRNVAALVTINGLETIVFDSQRTRGFEASAYVMVTRHWRLLANVTAQNARITNNPQGITLNGNRPQRVREHMANIWSNWMFAIGRLQGFRVGLGEQYQDRSFSDITNVNSVPSFLIGIAAFGYETPRWGLTLNLNNFTDRRYFIAANAAGAFPGESRAISAGARWTIGNSNKY